jgi:hypothetical protein
MALVRMVQVTLHEVIGMAAVRNCLVSASRAMSVLAVVLAACVIGGAGGRIRAAFGQLMLVNVPLMLAVKMSFVHIIDMIFVFDRRVPASRTMGMRMLVVRPVIRH